MKTWLVGSGIMAQEYAKVLREIGVDLTVIGRGDKSALEFEITTGYSVIKGGLDKYLSECYSEDLPDNVIVAVGVEGLSRAVLSLLNRGIKRILVEKPAGLNAKEIIDLNTQAHITDAEIYVAYNRRFFNSVREAKKIICADGGIKSFNFEFTEWAHEIEGLTKATGVKQNWLLANSSHVIDLAFYLGGIPQELKTYNVGNLEWHPSGSIFSGAGIASNGALFSYQANWEAPGRWGIELCTNLHRLILRPMEQLHIMRKGSIVIEPYSLNISDIDQKFKPGLFYQTMSFISSKNSDELCALSEHVKLLPIYQMIAGYN